MFYKRKSCSDENVCIRLKNFCPDLTQSYKDCRNLTKEKKPPLCKGRWLEEPEGLYGKENNSWYLNANKGELMYKYILWDIDGTVLDFLASEAYAVRTLFKKYGLGECTDEMLRLYSQINVKYWGMLEKNQITKPQVLIGRFMEFFTEIGIDTSVAESFNADYQVTLGDHIEFVRYAEEALLYQKGKYVLSAVTNGTKIAQEKKLRMSGLDKIFDWIFISEDIGAEKPNGEYFKAVFEKLGVQDKSQVLIIGDSLVADINGGYMAGIDTCWYNPLGKPNTLGIPVTYQIDSLEKISEIVK